MFRIAQSQWLPPGAATGHMPAARAPWPGAPGATHHLPEVFPAPCRGVMPPCFTSMVSSYPYRKQTLRNTRRCRAGWARSGANTARWSFANALVTTQSVKLKPGEVVVFSWIVYASRAQRNRINAAAMKDPRLADMMDPKAMPFDGKRMFMGGFKMVVDA